MRWTISWWTSWRRCTAIENQLVKTFGWDKQAGDLLYQHLRLPAEADANQGGKIAVVFANGAIMDGPQTPGNVGGDCRRAALGHLDQPSKQR